MDRLRQVFLRHLDFQQTRAFGCYFLQESQPLIMCSNTIQIEKLRCKSEFFVFRAGSCQLSAVSCQLFATNARIIEIPIHFIEPPETSPTIGFGRRPEASGPNSKIQLYTKNGCELLAVCCQLFATNARIIEIPIFEIPIPKLRDDMYAKNSWRSHFLN